MRGLKKPSAERAETMEIFMYVMFAKCKHYITYVSRFTLSQMRTLTVSLQKNSALRIVILTHDNKAKK